MKIYNQTMAIFRCICLFACVPFVMYAQDNQTIFQQEELQPRVREIFQHQCATSGCHAGATPQRGMNLSPQAFFEATVNQPTEKHPNRLRVKPGYPDSSYLVLKVRGDAAITGERMPYREEPLSQQEITIIIAWVQSLEKGTPNLTPATPVLLPFDAWSVVNLPTTRMLDSGLWLFYVGHRFIRDINSGIENFYGVDGSAAVLIKLGYAVTDDILISLGRSNILDNVELETKYRPIRQTPQGLPFSLAGRLVLNWLTEKSVRDKSERLKVSGNVILSSQMSERFAINVAPGILLNPNISKQGEAPLVTLGIGGKAHVSKKVAFVAEWLPIVGEQSPTYTRGLKSQFNAWSGGFEYRVGGHIFHVFVSNTIGLSTDLYMQGGDLDSAEGKMRLGFNIYRILDL